MALGEHTDAAYLVCIRFTNQRFIRWAAGVFHIPAFSTNFEDFALHKLGGGQVTLAENFGVDGRGALYGTAGCLRDVVQNHLFQIVALLAIEPPSVRGFGAVHIETAEGTQAMRPLRPRDVVRGQDAGYRREPGMAKNLNIETFCALRAKDGR